MADHRTGSIFCYCNSCTHGNAHECADYKCSCCIGAGGKPYQVNYIKDQSPPAVFG